MMLRMTAEEYVAHQARVGKKSAVAKPEPSGAKKAPSKQRNYARELAKQIKDAGLPEPQLEYAFDAQLEGGGRNWRFDLCWPKWLAVEVDGSVHRIKGRFKADLPKHQAAFNLGYKLLRVSPEQVRNGEALELVKGAFA